MDECVIKDICVGDIVVMSGVRPAGRTTDQQLTGRPTNGFLCILQGQAKFWVDGKLSATVEKGKLLYIPQGYRYKMQYTCKETVFVLVDFSLFDSTGERLCLFDELTLLGSDAPAYRFLEIMTQLEACGISRTVSSALQRKMLVYKLLSVIFEQTHFETDTPEKYPQISVGASLLRQRYPEDIPIGDLAKACHISVSSFRSLFRKQYGMSPLQYRNHLRIERAQQLLMEGSCTVSEAAYASGFENVGYFCRVYKALTGKTPGEAKREESK